VSKKARTLEIDEDLAFQRKEWFAQRAGITVLSLFVLAALLGVTGAGGVLSHTTAGQPGGGVYVEYEKFVRRGAMSTMTLRFHSDPPGFIQFWVSAPYLARVRIDSIAPIPQTVTVEEARQVYTIRAASTDVAVTVEMEHMTWGRLEGEVGIVGGLSERFTQISLF
jgi:hypothetical protein